MKLRIQPTFAAYILALAVLSSWKYCLCAVSALLVHELGHLIAGKLAGEEIESVVLTPFGGMMTYKQGNAPSKGIKGASVALAGPLANYILLVLISLFGMQHTSWSSNTVKQLMSSNLVMMLLNLLPALPLDGGSLLFSIGYFVFPVARLISVLSGIGMGTGLLIILMGIYGFAVREIFNCSLFIVGAYIMIYAARVRTLMLMQNTHAVLLERSTDHTAPRPLQFYLVPPDMQIRALFAPLQRSKAAAFVYEDDYNRYHVIDERTICQAILSDSFCTVSTVAENPITPKVY